VEFRVLGPLEVLDQGHLVELRGRRQRALLACLLLHANEVVSTERLLEDLWPGAHDAGRVQVAVSRVRKDVGEGRLLTRPPGYVLRVEPGECDRDAFEALVTEGRAALAEGRPEEAASVLRGALGLWRGSAFADFAYEPFVQGEAARLEEARLACLEERVEADLALGLHAELVGELERLVGQEPLRERLRAQLMLALYRSGRQAEALALYRETRRVWSDELGIEPGAALRRLEAAVLRQDEDLDLPEGFARPPRAEQERPGPDGGVAEPEEMAATAPTDSLARKTITLVLAEASLRGPTEETLDPEVRRRVLARYFTIASQVFSLHGASLERPLGDNLAAIFGIPRLHEDDALRAVQAALELREAMAHLNDELDRERGVAIDVRIGIDTGEVLESGPASPGGLVSGEPLGAAGRLAQAAGPGEIVISEATYRLVRNAVQVETAEVDVRGAAGRAFFLLDALSEPPERPESPFVGRSRERRLLEQALQNACSDRSCHLVTLLGAPGVGKSRLAREFLTGLGAEAVIFRGRCLAYGEGAFAPAAEMVQAAAGIAVDDSPDEARSKIAALVGDAGPEDVQIAGPLSALLGLSDALAHTREAFWAFRRLLEELARERPLVVVVDDLHWAQPPLLELLEYVADWVREAPMLLLCLARPDLLDERPHWSGGRANASSSLLEPLSQSESELLIQGHETSSLPEGARSKIVVTAEGNPLFLEQLLAHASEAATGADEILIPPTIHALLAARLDALEPQELETLERAAVVGQRFSSAAVAALLPVEPADRLPELVRALVRKELVRPGPPVASGEEIFRFRHALIREAAYERVPKETRAELHERYGDWLEQTAGEPTGELEETIGYHLEQASRLYTDLGLADDRTAQLARRAAARLASAGQTAVYRDTPAASDLLERAVALLPADDAARLQLLPELADALFLAGRLAEANAVCEQAIEAALRQGDHRTRAHALVVLLAWQLMTDPEGRTDRAQGVAQEALAIFEQAGDELGVARAWSLLSQVAFAQWRMAEARAAAERSLEHARRIGHERLQAWLLDLANAAMLWGPDHVDEAIARAEETLAWASTNGNRYLEAELLGYSLAVGNAMQGRFAEAREQIGQAKAILEELGLRLWRGHASNSAGYVEWLAGNPAAAEHELRAGIELLDEDERVIRALNATFLGLVLCQQNRWDEAAHWSTVSEQLSPGDSAVHQGWWRAARATLLAHQGRDDGVRRLANEATAAVRGTDSFPRADFHVILAEALRQVGETASAREHAREALRIYEQKGHLVGAANARALLANS
jgi:predicted ATPase/DNA-binding SARP family transcriptional activator/class 3 adenylate cyclase